MEETPPASAPYVAKETIEAVVRTSDQIIVGRLHARPQKRLKDELNVTDRFIAVTGARVYDVARAQLVYEAEFLLVAHAHIVTVTPLAAITRSSPAAWLPRSG